MKPLPQNLLTMLRRQEGAITIKQALGAGLTYRQVRTMVANGWGHPTSGVLVMPEPPDAFRASLRASLLATPTGVLSGVSAVRLHRLSGLDRWTAAERPHLTLPAGITYNRRAGQHRSSGLLPGDAIQVAGLPTTNLNKTITSMLPLMPPDKYICLLDSGRHIGWVPQASRNPKFRTALALSDPRWESALETLLRLLLVRAGLRPEALQYEVTRLDGSVARLDMAWPTVKLALEADGREVHDLPEALYHDRGRANDLGLAHWTICASPGST